MGTGVPFAIGAFAGEHGDVEFVALPRVDQGEADERRGRRDLDLFEEQFQAAGVRDFIEKVGDSGPHEHRDHAAAGDVIREDDAVGPRAQELRLGLLEVRARDDGEVGPQAARGQDDEDILRVGLGRGHEAARAFDAGLLEPALVRGVAQHGERASLLRARDFLRHEVDDDIRQPLGLEFGDDIAPHAAVAADDDVVGEFIHLASPLFLLPKTARLAGENDLRDLGERVGRHHAAADDQPHGENPPGLRERMHLGIADRGEGGDGHVKRVEQGPALDPAIARDADGRQHQQADDDGRKAVEHALSGGTGHGRWGRSCFIGIGTMRKPVFADGSSLFPPALPKEVSVLASHPLIPRSGVRPAIDDATICSLPSAGA